MKGFKYQIILKVKLKNSSQNKLNLTTKTAINHKFGLDKSFQEILYRIDNWINEGPGWIVEIIESQCINISTYRPLSGNSYIKLFAELRTPKNVPTNIKNNDQNVFIGVILGVLIP